MFDALDPLWILCVREKSRLDITGLFSNPSHCARIEKSPSNGTQQLQVCWFFTMPKYSGLSFSIVSQQVYLAEILKQLSSIVSHT